MEAIQKGRRWDWSQKEWAGFSLPEMRLSHAPLARFVPGQLCNTWDRKTIQFSAVSARQMACSLIYMYVLPKYSAGQVIKSILQDIKIRFRAIYYTTSCRAPRCRRGARISHFSYPYLIRIGLYVTECSPMDSENQTLRWIVQQIFAIKC